MALTALSTGLFFPIPEQALPFAIGTTGVIDATGEKFAMVGRVHWDGRPAAAKTIDTSGSSAIAWYGGSTAVFDNASTTLDVGIQGVGTTGPTAVPDGSYTVKAVVTTAADATPTLTTTNSWHTIVPTTGTASITHGDLAAVVWDMTNRAGSDAINIGVGVTTKSLFPVCNAYVAAAWGGTGVGAGPNVMLTASDGTRGTLDGTFLFGAQTAVTWADASNPDEYGLIFQVPFACKVDALYCMMRTVDATSDFTISLVSTPESTRATVASVSVDASQIGPVTAERLCVFNLASEVSLSANTDYCVAIKATGAGNVRFARLDLGHADARKFFPGGTTMRGVTANNGADFGSSSTTTLYPVGVRISQLQDGASSGGGAMVIGG